MQATVSDNTKIIIATWRFEASWRVLIDSAPYHAMAVSSSHDPAWPAVLEVVMKVYNLSMRLANPSRDGGSCADGISIRTILRVDEAAMAGSERATWIRRKAGRTWASEYIA